MTMDEAQFVERLRSMMERHRDPALHAAIWSYREGALTREQLLVHPAYGAAMNADTERMQRALEARGFTPERLRAKLVRELTTVGLYPPAAGQPDIVAEVDPAE